MTTKPAHTPTPDALTARVAELEAALREIANHFCDVLSGPMFAGVRFEDGPEGVPTIAAARAALAKD